MGDETLTSMAKRMGQTVSDVADAKPWSAKWVASYAEKHGKRSDPIGYQHLPDVQIASAVRMLMRNDLDHEGVVCAARDRICALHTEKSDLREALRMALEWIDAVPQDAELPAMPGFDRDWVNGVLAK